MTQFSPQNFERMDEEEDRVFYQQARKVVHIDDGPSLPWAGCSGNWCRPAPWCWT